MSGEECSVEARIELAVLTERIKSLSERQDRAQLTNERAIKLASDELARRLDNLNHAHQQAVEVQNTYLPRETFGEIEKRVNMLELEARENRGRMWLPMVMAATLAASVAVAATKLLFP